MLCPLAHFTPAILVFFLFLEHPKHLLISEPWVVLPSWNHLPQICLLMACLHCSRQLSQHFPGRCFLTSQPKVAFISYSLILKYSSFPIIWNHLVHVCNTLKRHLILPRSLPSYIICLGTGTLAVLFTSVSSTHGTQYSILCFWINYVKRKLIDVRTWHILTTTDHFGKPRYVGSIHFWVAYWLRAWNQMVWLYYFLLWL